MDTRARVIAGLRSIEGVVESPSMFGPDDAFWCNGTEIVHLHGGDVVELRLTRAAIREQRPALRADDRVTLRKGSSDWIEVHVAATRDIAFVLELAEQAAVAHRAGAEDTPKAPPAGADLERRRRFH